MLLLLNLLQHLQLTQIGFPTRRILVVVVVVAEEEEIRLGNKAHCVGVHSSDGSERVEPN